MEKIEKSKRFPLISIVIPCFNEKETILEVVNRVKSAPLPNKEIIIVDDYSTDGTREIIREKIEPKVDIVIYHEKNMGKGAALRNGFKVIRGDIVVIQDADLELDPSDCPKLIKPILEGKADVVYGSRFIGFQKNKRSKFFKLNFLANKFLTLLSNIFSGLNLSDMETCYKVFKKNIIDKITIKEDRFGFEPEFTAKVAKLKCRIYEVGVSYKSRSYADGKKISWKDGLRTLWCILKYNLFIK